MNHDLVLAELIRNALMIDAHVSSQPISVHVCDAIVILRGTVQSFARKKFAEQIASGIDGVVGVVNELEVTSPGLVGDDTIAAGVRAALDAHPDITKETVTVQVKEGGVTLRGTVKSDWERSIAQDIAVSVSGVRSVRNLIFGSGSDHESDAALSRNIQTAINLTLGLEASNIRVAVDGDTAVLSGLAARPWHRYRVERVVRRFPIRKIRNEITIP